MQRHRSSRRKSLLCAVVAGATAALIVTVGAGILSVWGHFWVSWRDVSVGVFRGTLAVSWGHERPAVQILSPGWHVRRFEPGWKWAWPSYQSGPPYSAIRVPVWLMGGAIATVVGATGWRMRRTPDRMACGACGYDLSGLPAGGTCPECGNRLPFG